MPSKNSKYKLKVKFGIQDELFSDVHKNVIKAKYFASLQPDSRISKFEVDRINKLINEKIKSQSSKSNATSIDSK